MNPANWQVIAIVGAVISAAIVYWALTAFSSLDHQVCVMIAGIVAVIDFGAFQLFLKDRFK